MSHRFEDFDLYDRVQCSTDSSVNIRIQGKVGSVTEIVEEGQMQYLGVDFGINKVAFLPSHLWMLTIIKKSVTAKSRETQNGRT